MRKTMNTYPPHALREPDACQYLGLKKTKFRQMVKAGELPAGYLHGRCRVWIAAELITAFDEAFGAANDNAKQEPKNSWDDV